MRKYVLFFAAILICNSIFADNAKPVFLFDRNHQDSIILKDGAKLENGILKLNGKKGYAEFKNSSAFNFAESGMTLVGEVKLFEDPKTENYIARDMILSKGHEIIFGRDGTRLYYNFNTGKRWGATFWGGSIPPKNEWIQFVCTVERLNDITQAEVGYRVSFYINGSIEARGKFMYVNPEHNNSPIQIGCGFGGGTWLVNGEIAKAAVYDRPLTENEIAELMDKSQYVKIIENDIKPISKKLTSRLAALEKNAKTPQAKFLLDSVNLAILDGFNQQNTNILPAKKLISSNLSFDELFNQWQNRQNKKGLAVMATPDAAIVTASVGTGGTGFPVYGMFDRKSQRSIFGRKGLEWQINAVTPDRKQLTFSSFASKWRIVNMTKNSLDIEWQVAKNIKAFSKITLKNARLEANFKIDNNDKNIRIETVTFPKVRFRKLNGNDALTYPSMSGILIKNPTKEQFTGGQDGYFPSGRANMQFSTYYDEKSGIYFAFEDPLARSKYYSVKGKRNNIVCTWDSVVGHTAAEKNGGNDFETSGKFVIELFNGDWFDGGQLYKKFLSEKASWWIKELPRKSTPEWFRNTCLRILGVKCSQLPNFTKTKNEVIKLRKYFEMPIAFHWYGWEDPAKGGWPHFYPKDFSLAALKEMKSHGIYVKPYIDSRLWREKDGKNGKSDWMYSSHGKKFAVKQLDGKPVMENYGAPYAVECPAAKGWQDYMVSLVDRLAGYGFDAVYHDQVATGRYYLCYDASHGHKFADPDAWFGLGYQPMYQKIRALKNKYPDLAHDTEEAADPYLQAMDGYMVWRWTDPGQIPLFTSIYSGRIQFTGRLFNHQYPGDYESFFAKIAEQLVLSEQIGWFDYPDMQDGTKRLYTKKAAHLRHALLNYFNESDMQHPLNFKAPVPELRSKWGAVGNFNVVVTPKVRHAFYKRTDGSKMVIFANSTNEKITVYPELELHGKLLGICREGSAKAEITSKIPAVSLAPRSFEVWIISDFEQLSKETSRIAETMKKISEFTPEIEKSPAVVTPALGNSKSAVIKGNGKFQCLAETVPLAKNMTYKFSCELRKNAPLSQKKTDHRIVIYNRHQGKYKQIAKLGENITPDNKWYKCETTFKVPDIAGDFQIYLYNCNSVGTVEMKYPVFIPEKQ